MVISKKYLAKQMSEATKDIMEKGYLDHLYGESNMLCSVCKRLMALVGNKYWCWSCNAYRMHGWKQ